MSDLGYFLSCAGVGTDAVRIVEALEAENTRLREALAFYADPAIYEQPTPTTGPLRAREALEAGGDGR